METLEFDYVSELVRKRSAIVLEREKGYLVESRLMPLARKEGFTSISDVIAKMRTTDFSPLHEKVVEAMTTNETSFFRDLQPFEALRKGIIPELISRRSTKRRLRIWSAACSSGQEPYTIALVIREHFPELANWDVKILATDISTQILDKAKQAKFNQIEVNRGLPMQYLIKYFDRQELNWQLKSQVRSLVEFRQMNLNDMWPAMDDMDIVFIRNVLIYFDIETKKQILCKVKRQMCRDGYLFLGGAESTINLDDSFVRSHVEQASIYRIK